MKKAVASRASWLRGMAEKQGYTLERDDGGRYVLERDGMSKRYSFAACLEALTTGKDLPQHTARPHTSEPIMEDKTEETSDTPADAELVLTPGDALSGGGWWVSDGKLAMWKPTRQEAEAFAASGDMALAHKLLKRSDAH